MQGRFGIAFDWLGVERAWTRTRGRSDVVIGIIDQGVQLDHPLLGPNIQPDVALHVVPSGNHEIAGTHAAGVAAGRACEVERFSGVAPEARILPVRFSDGAGQQALNLAHAIEYGVEMGASIINIAHQANLGTATVRRAMEYAATRNVLIVCPATENDDLLPNQITVLSVNEKFEPLSKYSQSGAHIAAPGFARVPHWGSSGHAVLSEADIGAPYVSGCAALVKSLNPGWGYHEIKEHLLVSGTPRAELTGKCLSERMLSVSQAVLGPIDLATDAKELHWSSLGDALLAWRLRYRSAFCVNAVALYRPHGDEHWRELGFARAGAERMMIPAAALRRSSGTLRIACRESNFHSEEIALTIR